jgi:hypothetical protein
MRATDGINPLRPRFVKRVPRRNHGLTGPGIANVNGGQFVAPKPSAAVCEEIILKEPDA